MQGLSVKCLCLRAVGLHQPAQMALMKDEKFLHIRSQVTAALWFHHTHWFLSSHWCSHLVFFSYSFKSTWSSQVALVAATVFYSVCFKTENHDVRARNTSMMVTYRDLLWVAFTCMQGDDTTLIHHPPPT